MTKLLSQSIENLSQEERAILQQPEADIGLFKQIGQSFSGPLRFWTFYALLMSLLMFGASVYGLYRMFIAPDIRAMLLWGALFGSGFFSVGLVKIWFWMRINQLAVLRELKLIQVMLSRRSD